MLPQFVIPGVFYYYCFMKKLLLTALLVAILPVIAHAQECGVSADNFIKIFGADEPKLEKLLTPCFEKNNEGSYQRKVTVNGEEDFEYINYEDKTSIFFVTPIQKNRDDLKDRLVKYGFKHTKDAKSAEGDIAYFLKDKYEMRVWQGEGTYYVTIEQKK
ncbi:MAG: hypothetical protein EBZ77_05365 [Chitinophagia bacterium]|nr:hypothetical protein [Chitinophagia bacterium]